MTKFSAVIITLNEADRIASCLEPLKKVADEIIVVDSFSQDKTVAICQKMGARVVQKEWSGYSGAKNFGNSLCKNNWVISIDADEVLSPELVQSIRDLAPKEGKVYAFDRLPNYCGKWIWHSGWYPDWKVRIFNRQQVHWQGDFVHETLHIPKHFEVIRLRGKLYHYTYKSSADHWQRIEKYARLSALEMQAEGKRASILKGWLSPIARFFKTFILKKGFLDGKEGWIISRRNAYLARRKHQILKALNQKKSV